MAVYSAFDWPSLTEAEAPVFDSENNELGKVGGGRTGYFKVDVSGGFDFWLPQDTIANADREGVRLTCSGKELEDRKNAVDAGELTETEVEEGTDNLPHSLPVERRYEAEAEYLSGPRQL